MEKDAKEVREVSFVEKAKEIKVEVRAEVDGNIAEAREKIELFLLTEMKAVYEQTGERIGSLTCQLRYNQKYGKVVLTLFHRDDNVDNEWERLELEGVSRCDTEQVLNSMTMEKGEDGIFFERRDAMDDYALYYDYR